MYDECSLNETTYRCSSLNNSRVRDVSNCYSYLLFEI